MKKNWGLNNMEIWKSLGNDIKAVKRDIEKIITNPDYQKILDKKTMNHLVKTLEDINKFKDRAEDRMFKRENLDDDKQWLKIFYGE